MPQRLDDVTGDPIRLSARQREAQREQTIETVNQIIVQLNAVTARTREHDARLDAHDQALAVLTLQYQTWRTLTFWPRVRALFLGVPKEPPKEPQK